MAKIETVYTPEEIKNYAERDFVISALGRYPYSPYMSIDTLDDNFCFIHYLNMYYGKSCAVKCSTQVNITRFTSSGRKIGLIRDTLSDGSFYLSILGDGTLEAKKKLNMDLEVLCEFPILPNTLGTRLHINTANNETYWDASTEHSTIYEQNLLFASSGSTGLTEDDALGYVPEWADFLQSDNVGLFRYFATMNGTEIGVGADEFQLSDDVDNTLVIGDPTSNYNYVDIDSQYLQTGYKNVGGSLSDINRSRLSYIIGLNGFDVGSIVHYPPTPGTVYLTEVLHGSYAQRYIPFNLILTKSEAEAKNYLQTGVLPSDAFIFPYDVDNIPINDSGEDPGTDPTDDSGNVPGEDGTPSDDTDPMPIIAPDYTPQSLTNNNLYWLTAAGLKNFIEWFWTDATDVATMGDLWDKITGLYENLAQSILNIRYMPIDISWVGNVSSDTKIIVGMIEKTQAVSVINKTAAPVRQIGTFNIETLFNGSWANYSPYSSILLYLPFHGMVELDNDLIMGHTIAIDAAYDILAGTIQYFVHRDGYTGPLIYTTTAKMAVDIPITLQTKTDRDSAIIQNVGSVTAGLIGAGASAAAGSPIGLTMGLANLSGFQPTSAPMQVKGNISESGAFYSPPKCAIYIKRPAYNRPSVYAQRVGFPANVERVLNKCRGFTTCYKPRIDFKGNRYTEDSTTVYLKPTKDEVDEIYAYLEKGVIL